MAGKKSPGMISLVLLVGLGLLGTVWAGLLGVTRQALKDWQLKQEARQDAVLFRSLCGIREGEPFLAPGEKRQLEPDRRDRWSMLPWKPSRRAGSGKKSSGSTGKPEKN